MISTAVRLTAFPSPCGCARALPLGGHATGHGMPHAHHIGHRITLSLPRGDGARAARMSFICQHILPSYQGS